MDRVGSPSGPQWAPRRPGYYIVPNHPRVSLPSLHYHVAAAATVACLEGLGLVLLGVDLQGLSFRISGALKG